MMDKKFTEKVGYEKALDFDPVNGIVKFGSYESSLKDLGVKPIKTYQVKFEDYLDTVLKKEHGSFAKIFQKKIENPESYKQQFEADVKSGKFAGPLSKADGTQKSHLGGYIDIQSIISGERRQDSTYRNLIKNPDDSYTVEAYSVPSDQVKGFELLNEINKRAASLNSSFKANRTNDALRQNQQDSRLRRQGAASTILSGAGGAASKVINS